MSSESLPQTPRSRRGLLSSLGGLAAGVGSGIGRIVRPGGRTGPAEETPRPAQAGKPAALLKKNFSISYTERGLVRRYRLGGDSLTIGRGRDCDVRINDGSVAPVHCRIEQAADGGIIILAEDDGHPVRVNGNPVEFQRLSGGETISVGPVALTVAASLGVGAGREEVRAEIAFDQDFGAALIRWFMLDKLHWIVVSCAIHFLLLILLANWLEEDETIGAEGGFFQNGFAEAPGDFPLTDDSEMEGEEFTLDDPAEPELAELEQMRSEPLAGEPSDFIDPDLSGAFGHGGTGLDEKARERLGQAIGPAGGSGVLFGPGSGWAEHVGKLRDTGLDVAILFDSTGSMVSLTTEVSARIGEMVVALDRIVPDLRISLVTYKGDPGSSRYVVAGTPLVKDIYELFNFMNSVDVSGGSAEGYAAVTKGMRHALEELHWREGTEKAIVIIGDAPAFPKTQRKAFSLARRFSGSLSTIYKESRHTASFLEPATLDLFKRLGSAGGGEFIRYDSEGNVVRRIVSVVLGSKWAAQIDRVFDYEEKGRWEKILDRRVANGDVDWLMRQFTKQTVRPEAVEALIRLGGEDGRTVSAHLWRILRQRRTPPWLMQRCIYVFSRLTNLKIDYIRSSRSRLDPKQLAYIQEVLVFVYGKNFLRTLPPASPPAAAGAGDDEK